MKKIVLMMKFYLVFTFLGVLNVIAGSAYSQENLKLNLKEVSLHDALPIFPISGNSKADGN